MFLLACLDADAGMRQSGGPVQIEALIKERQATFPDEGAQEIVSSVCVRVRQRSIEGGRIASVGSSRGTAGQ